ncbi:MAG: hypothetical protein IJW98_01375, partial [Clostridia bacterium]|nr:hypothetical protein [Clostridia bacterium]
NQKDANLTLACVYKPFYSPKNISLYELIYASDIKTEFPDNPYQNDGSMMTAHRIKSLVLQYFGYEVPQTMFRELLLEGVEYFPESDAYGFAHTDTSGFVPSNPMYGYRLNDGYWLVHLCAFEEEGDHVMVMLNPRVNGFYIAAGQLVDRKDVFKEPERPVTPPVQLPTESMKETILRQYAQKYGKDVSKLSLRVIGQYSDNYIVFVDDADTLYPDKFTTDMVAGYDFRYGTAQTLLVYRSLNGRFYTLFDAYKDGLLTSTTIRTLYNQYKTKYPDLYNSDYFHQAIGQEAAKAYAKEYGKDLSKLSVRVAGVFLRFDGDYFAVFVDEAGVRYENKPSQEVVGGKVFRYSTTQRLLIYTDGKFYSLAEFYEKDLIPYSDLYEQYRTYQSHLYEDSYVYPLIEKEMVSQYAHMYGKQESKLTAQLIYTYTYQNAECYVLFMNDQDQPSENRLIGQRVGDHIFYSRAPQTLLVYYDGSFYTLSKAYEDTMDVALLNVPKLSTLYLHYRSLYPELYEESYLQQIAEAEIKQLCVKQYGKGKASDYTVRFMTSYLDAYVVYVDGKYVADQAVSAQRVGGLIFAYPDQKAMKVYWDGRFYALADALEQQVIDYDTVKRLYSLHEAELVKEIVKAHQKADGCSKAVDSHRIEFVAQMDDRYAIYVHCPGLSYTAAMTTVTINGLDFVYGSSHMIEIYHNGKMYSVQSAFEKGILSENQLRYLYEIHRGNYDYPYSS